MTPRSAVATVGLFALAFALRAFDLATPAYPTGDEPYHLPAAALYCDSGQMDETTWSHPPLAALGICASVALLGDNPWGWRMRSVLLGALTIVAVALLAFELYPERPAIGFVGALLLAVDPLHVLLSRSTLEEVQATFFFVLAAWSTQRHVRRGAGGLVLAGVLLGCAHASKAYFHLAGLVLLLAALAALRRRGAPATAYVHAAVALAILPAAIYVAAFLPWFARGHGLFEFLALQREALHAVAAKTLDTFQNGELLALGGTPATWFTHPKVFGIRLPSQPDQFRGILFAKNFLAWVAVLPAVALIASRWRAGRDPVDLLVVGLFAAIYLPLLALNRPIFLYSAIAVLPVAFIAIGRAIDLAGESLRRPAAFGVALACAVGLYLYPAATAIAVPAWAYRPLASGVAPTGSPR